MFGAWPRSPSGNDRETPGTEVSAERAHLDLARESLRELLGDQRLPGGVREALADDYGQVQAMLEKLEHGHVHIAAFGRVRPAARSARRWPERWRRAPIS